MGNQRMKLRRERYHNTLFHNPSFSIECGMNHSIIELSGWLPAIIFPAATLIQLIAILRSSTIEGVSPLTWTLFGIANISIYIYTEKYLAVQPIIGFLGTAVLDFVIASMALRNQGRQKS